MHKIGSILNPNSIYTEKYQKEYENFILQAENIKMRENWNTHDKIIIKKKTRKEALFELNNRKYIDNKKFDILDIEVDKALNQLGLF